MYDSVRGSNDEGGVGGADDAHQHASRAGALVDRGEGGFVAVVSVGHVDSVIGEGIGDLGNAVGVVDSAECVGVAGGVGSFVEDRLIRGFCDQLGQRSVGIGDEGHQWGDVCADNGAQSGAGCLGSRHGALVGHDAGFAPGRELDSAEDRSADLAVAESVLVQVERWRLVLDDG